EDSIAPKKGYPGNHPNDVRRPKRYRAQQEEADLPEHSANVKHQEVSDVEADEQRHCPDDQRKLERAQVEPQRHTGRENFDVVVKNEGWVESTLPVVKEADSGDDQHW